MIRSKRKKPRRGRLDAKGMAELRQFVFQRDGYRCQQVYKEGRSTFLCNALVTWDSGHLCHIKSRGAGGHDTKENTFCGCSWCHNLYHRVGPSMKKICPKK